MPKQIVENGVILIQEKTDDDKMMNDIARRMKSGQADIASQLGISVDTLQNYKMLAEMIAELEELIDTGIAIFT